MACPHTQIFGGGFGIISAPSFDPGIVNFIMQGGVFAFAGIRGGGLVVAAAAIQRPDLFQAVVPKVAPLDMLRFENFTVGHLRVKEYGTVKDSLSFTKLLAYSPYHNIQEDVNYPAMLVITSENDLYSFILNAFSK